VKTQLKPTDSLAWQQVQSVEAAQLAEFRRRALTAILSPQH
jgi:hypothetical protein